MTVSKKPTAKNKGPIPVPDWSKNTVIALQALAAGVANDGQQKECLRWFIYEACKTYDNPFLMPDGLNLNWVPSFMAGRAYAGQQTAKLLNMKVGLLKDD